MTPAEKTQPDTTERRAALALLAHSAAPDAPVLRRGVAWLVLAAALDALGPVLGKAFIDSHLLPRNADLPAIAGLLDGALAAGWLYQKLSAPAVARTRALRSDLNAQVAESIAGMAVIQANAAAGRFLQRFAATNQAHLDSRRAELRANAWLLRPALDFLNVALLAAVIAVFGLRQAGAALDALEVGVLYAFVAYIARVVEPLIQITMQFSQLQQAVVAAARVNTLLHEAQAPPATGSGTVGAGRITVRKLHFGYQPGRPVLHGLDIEMAAGQFVGIVGHIGSGKSTLLALLLRFYPALPAHCALTASRSPKLLTPISAARWAWCHKSLFCWPPAHATTSPWAGR